MPVKSIAEVKAPIQTALSKTVYFNRNLELVGDVRPFSMVDVFPKIPGKIIEKIFVEKGDLVKKGDLVAVLESSAIEARIEEAGAALESAQARVKQAQANLEILEKDRERLVNLYQQKAIALQKVDHIEAQYTAALESRRLAAAQVKQARAAIKQLTIFIMTTGFMLRQAGIYQRAMWIKGQCRLLGSRFFGFPMKIFLK